MRDNLTNTKSKTWKGVADPVSFIWPDYILWNGDRIYRCSTESSHAKYLVSTGKEMPFVISVTKDQFKKYWGEE